MIKESQRDKSQPKYHHQHIKSQYTPVISTKKNIENIENKKVPNTASTNATDNLKGQERIKERSLKEKKASKYSFINIDNVNKRIIPKTKKVAKKQKNGKKCQRDKSARPKEAATITYDNQKLLNVTSKCK